jgi:sterol desaturase/sphingolipid hydroxylase (fatty acid hydroxylase superfamily)
VKEFMLLMGEDLQFLLFFGFLVFFVGVERLLPRRHPSVPQFKRWWTNASLTILVILSLPLLPVSFITAAAWAEKNGVGLLNLMQGDLPKLVPELLPELLLIVVTLLLRGFISFFTYYLNHKIPLLWRFHRVHHLDTELDVSSTVRFHPLEMPLSLAVGLPLVVAFGLSPWVLLFYELFDVTVTLFSHSNIRLPERLNRYLRYVIVTPDLHKVHHSVLRPETDSNYSAVFPIWDILFGTFKTKTREPLETMKLGLEEIRDPRTNSFWWLLASPFIPGRSEQNQIEVAT